MNRKYLVLALAAGTLTSLLWGAFRYEDLSRKNITDQLLADTYRMGSDGHIGTAINLLIEGKFYGTPEDPFFGLVPRSPAYSLLIALGLVLFGVHIWVPWLINAIFYLISIALLYEISLRFLEGKWAVLPPLFLALFWGAFEFVWIINTEMLTLFSILLFVYGLIRYRESLRLWWLALSALGLSLLVLNKSIAQYFILLALGLVMYALYQNFYPRKFWHHWGVFFGIIAVLVGGWMARNYLVLGSTDFSRGGHALLIHSKMAELRGEKMTGFMLSQMFGDYIADKFVPGYAASPEPLTTQRYNIGARWKNMRYANVPELETDQQFYAEAGEIIRNNPIQFVLIAPFWFLRLNGPVHYNLAAIDHLFVGTHEYLPPAVKIIILVGIYIAWFLFIFIALWHVVKTGWNIIKKGKFSYMVWIVALVFYFNIVYSVFAHAEVRYILPVMPFYFLFFVFFAERMFGRWTNASKV